MNTIETNIAVARQFLAAMAKLDIDGMTSLVAPDFILDSKGSSSMSGPRTLAELPQIIQMMRHFLPKGATLEILNMTADESRVACEAKGDAMTVDGKPYRNQYHFLIELKNAKITKCSEYMDTRLMDEIFSPLIAQMTAAKT